MSTAETSIPLLSLEGVDTFYGAIQVHFGINLQVYAREIVCLLGGNASGKSTTMKVILGLVKTRSGSVFFESEEIQRLSTPEIVRRGIGSVPEARRIFPAMTVRENLLMGAYLRKDKDQIFQDYERILDMFPSLKDRLSQQGGKLSGGEQQMLAFGRALMGRPRLILMDEPTMGLSPALVDQVLETIQAINRQGVTVFMIDQNADLALQIAHRGYVIQSGHIVLTGEGKDLLDNPELRDAYLGSGVVR